jgi:hypothetical protein
MYNQAHGSDSDIIADCNTTQDVCSCTNGDAITNRRPSRVFPITQYVANSQSTVRTHRYLANYNWADVMYAEPWADLGMCIYLNIGQDLREQYHYVIYRTKNGSHCRRR